MKISTIQVKNYRSIKAAKVSLGELTVLLGKNNEGKSNFLMAVNLSITTLQIFANLRRRRIVSPRYAYENNESYIWERDYPISQQKGKKRDKKTVFVLEFVLDEAEIEEFRKNIGSQLNGSLQIKIVFDNDSKSDITVVKQGKGSQLLNEKSQKVAKYIAEHIEYNYIPAVRTIDHTMDIINDQILSRLQEERDNKEYKEALNVIANIEKRILENLTTKVKAALVEFLPDINDVTINAEDLGSMIRRRQDYMLRIDDGEETDLRNKGDGVKSLVAMSLLKNKKAIPNSASVIAIEEPESHLHPSAIDALRKAILSLSGRSQVIITTHNPQFVNRNQIDSNVIVDNGNAEKAASIREIREVLGVKLSDNLFNARLLLYVEGITDREVIKSLLCHNSETLRTAINNNELVIQPMSGTHHIEMHLNTAKTMLADYHVLLDGDGAGRDATRRSVENGLLDIKDYTLTKYDDMPQDSEMEDMLDSSIYHDEILSRYGVNISVGSFRARNRKWSDRVRKVFEDDGKIFDENLLNSIKLMVFQKVIEAPDAALRPQGLGMLQKLISTLEQKL